MFLYVEPFEHIARSLTPTSMPIDSFVNSIGFCSTSIPTETNQLTPSNVTLGFVYLEFSGILLFSDTVLIFVYC
jgi:hypothetical protein